MLADLALLALMDQSLLAGGSEYIPTQVSVVDGDTLKVDGTNVRISNPDIPERGGAQNVTQRGSWRRSQRDAPIRAAFFENAEEGTGVMEWSRG